MGGSGPVWSDPALRVVLSGAAREGASGAGEGDAARVRLVDRVGRFTAPHVTVFHSLSV